MTPPDPTILSEVLSESKGKAIAALIAAVVAANSKKETTPCR